MGDNHRYDKSGYKSSVHDRLFFLAGIQHYSIANNNPIRKGMESKILIWGLNLLFTSGYGYVIFLNIDNIKGVVLFFIMVLYGLVRILFYCIKQDQDRRMRNLDIEAKRRSMQSPPTL